MKGLRTDVTCPRCGHLLERDLDHYTCLHCGKRFTKNDDSQILFSSKSSRLEQMATEREKPDLSGVPDDFLKEEAKELKTKLGAFNAQLLSLERRSYDVGEELRKRDGRSKIGRFFKIVTNHETRIFTPYLHPKKGYLETLTIFIEKHDFIKISTCGGWWWEHGAIEITPVEVGGELCKRNAAWYDILKQVMEASPK